MKNSAVVLWVLALLSQLLIVQGDARTIHLREEASPSALQEAINNCQPGDSIIVTGGYFLGPLQITKAVTLIGQNWPIVDGRNQGTVVYVEAPYVTLQGFVIQNSGSSLNREDAGIWVDTTDAVVQSNRLINVLFGIYLRKAHRSVIRKNWIAGKKELPIPERGDLIRAWYSRDLKIENNTLKYGRDVIIWFSKNTLLQGNSINNARYGIHFMYSSDCQVVHNRLTGNSVGAYLMYSRRLKVKQNIMAYNRGPSGFGVGLKDLDDVEFVENLIVDNRIGLFVDNCPREFDTHMIYQGNVFAYNDVGVYLLAFLHNSDLTQNSFLENYQQVAINGAGRWVNTRWHQNFWSDYAGFDSNGDGIGDIPYRSEKLFESLIDRYKGLRLFLYSPAIQAVNFAAKAFPVVKPQPKFSDSSPRMHPYFPSVKAGIHRSHRWPLLVVALGLVLLGSLSITGFTTRKNKRRKSPAAKNRMDLAEDEEVKNVLGGSDKVEPIIQVRNLTKRFGHVVAVNNVSFTIQEGEALALWGANGAGKTTILRCLLGILPFEGEIQIFGIDVARQGKNVRKRIGFVPQEVRFHENLTVEETLDFYAGLRKTSVKSFSRWMERLELRNLQKKTIGELSGGMKQRLALAIAMLSDPAILFLDEPTANLDMKSRENFLELLRELKAEGKTILFSSHRMEEVFSFASRVLILDQGKIIVDAPPTEVYEHLGKATMLRLFLPQEQLPRAIEVLAMHGFRVSRNGMGLKVVVDFHSKGKPITLLAEAGISVNDFDYEVEVI